MVDCVVDVVVMFFEIFLSVSVMTAEIDVFAFFVEVVVSVLVLFVCLIMYEKMFDMIYLENLCYLNVEV